MWKVLIINPCRWLFIWTFRAVALEVFATITSHVVLKYSSSILKCIETKVKRVQDGFQTPVTILFEHVQHLSNKAVNLFWLVWGKMRTTEHVPRLFKTPLSNSHSPVIYLYMFKASFTLDDHPDKSKIQSECGWSFLMARGLQWVWACTKVLYKHCDGIYCGGCVSMAWDPHAPLWLSDREFEVELFTPLKLRLEQRSRQSCGNYQGHMWCPKLQQNVNQESHTTVGVQRRWGPRRLSWGVVKTNKLLIKY